MTVVKTSKVEFDRVPDKRLRDIAKSKISDKETILFCLLAETPAGNNGIVVVTDYQLVVACVKGGPFDHNGEMYASFDRSGVNMYRDWLLSRGFGQLGPVTTQTHTAILGKSGWKVYFDLGYRDSLGNVSPLKLFFENESLANQFVAVVQKAKNDDFVRSKTPAPAAGIVDIGDQLVKLADLLEAGHLTQAEFEAAKRKLLGF